METVTRFAERQAGSVSAIPTPGPEVARTLSVTASYLLSEDGRKASLLAGGDGRAVQQIPLQVPANRLHLVSVDKQGVARLKLRPRFERDGERGVVRIDAVADLRRAADDRRTLSGRREESRTGERLLCRARRPALEAERRRPRPPRERRGGVPCGQGTTRRRAPAAVAQAVLHHDGARSLAVRRRDRPGTREGRSTRGTPALPRGSAEPRKNAIVRTEPNSSRSTKRRSGSSPSGSRRTEPTNRRCARPPACFRWPRRLKASPIRRSPSTAACRSTRAMVLSVCRRSFVNPRGLVDTVVGPSDVTVRSSATP